MNSATHRPSFDDLRLVCDYLRGVRNEIALDVHTIGMAGKDPDLYGKIPRPSRWLAKVRYLPFLSKVVHRVSLPVWHFLAPVLFNRQLRAMQGQRRTGQPAQFDAGGQLIALSLRTLDIVHTRHIDPMPRQWLEFPWLRLGKRPEGVRTLAAASLLDDADLRRSLALARLAHRVLPRRRGMSGWGLQSYTAWRWFFARIAVDKLPGPLLMIEHFDRWAVLVDGSIQRSRQRQPVRRLTLMQHGSVNADVTPRGLGVALPTRLRAVNHLHVYSAADAQVFKEEILSPTLVERGIGVSFYRPSIALTDMCEPGIPSILFVGYPLCEAAHRALMRALRDAGQWQLFYKPHPTNRASAGIALLPWIMVEGRSVFPRVDLIVSYPSTLVSEYAAHGIPAVVHRMDVSPDQIVGRMSEILQITRGRGVPAATNICETAIHAAPSPTPPPMTLAPLRPYRICGRCIMDTSDPNIRFDAQGLCEYCNNFDTTIKPNWHTDAEGERRLARLADTIRQAGRGRDFDCIIGLSGGLDSSYSAYVAKEKMGLRPLLFHVDAGWNTDQAVGNIEKLVDGLGLDLYTEVINWEEMKDLQVAFLKSGIPDQDLPQDAAFFSSLYKFARQYKIKHVITGSNFSTECCREPEEWGGYLGIDTMLFHDIHRRFGKRPLETFPLKDILVYKLYYQNILGMKVHHPLNLVPFIKKDAEDELDRRFGWQRFQHKHHESRFTRFYEDYWLPRKFGFHKRRAHFSSLIVTGQMTREAALARIARPEMHEHFLKQEFEYVAHKLDLSVDDLQQIFDGPNKTYRDYRNKRWMIGLGANAMRWLGLEKRYFR